MRTLFRHGRPKDLALRFWEKVNKDGPVVKQELGPCWTWTGGTGGVGYGRIGYENKTLEATHVAVYLETDKWPVLNVCHKCDNVACVRYSHLFEGTHQHNMEDMAKKERGTGKLTPEEVTSLRQSYATGSFYQEELGEKYGITGSSVSRIVNGKRRQHIPMEEK